MWSENPSVVEIGGVLDIAAASRFRKVSTVKLSASVVKDGNYTFTKHGKQGRRAEVACRMVRNSGIQSLPESWRQVVSLFL